MAETYRCPQGHQWAGSDGTVILKVTCPECGQAPVSGAAPPGYETATLPPPTPGLETQAAHAAAGSFGLPEQFGRYRILKELGRGGMGSVYLAHDAHLDRPVALKVPHFAPGDGPQVMERFYREARGAATLQHPNICPVFDVGRIGGIHYLTMGLIEGKPLSAFVKPDKPLPPRQVVLLIRKLALALDEAHRRGIIHRDLKPSNVMINQRSEPVVMDFGLAKRVAGGNGGDARLTGSGMILGTPSYMSPEQARGEVDLLGPGCDIYSLGVMLYELLAGRLPFQGSVAVVIAQVLLDSPEPPSKWRPGVDPRLEAICLKAMAKDIKDRYPTMAAFAAALTEYLKADKASDTVMTPPAGSEPSTLALMEANLRASGLAPSSGGKQRSRLAIAVGAVGGVSVVGLLGWVLFQGLLSRSDAPTRTTASLAAPEPTKALPPDHPPVAKPSLVEAKWVSLFNGKDLAGWQLGAGPGIGNWEVKNGLLVGSQGAKYLFTQRNDLVNFHYRVEAMINAEGNGGLLARASPHLRVGGEGYLVKLKFKARFPGAIGSLIIKNESGQFDAPQTINDKELIQPDQWFTQEIIAVGNHLVVKVNDQAVVDCIDAKNTFSRGRLGLQVVNRLTVLTVRKVEVKELPADAPVLPGGIEFKNPVRGALADDPPAGEPGKPVVAAAPPFAWPADDLREGRVPAPDLSKLKPLFQDEFDDPKSGFLQSKRAAADASNESAYQKGRYVQKHMMHVPPERGGRIINRGVPWKPAAAFAVQVEGRVLTKANDSWGLIIDHADHQRGIWVLLTNKGGVIVSGTASHEFPGEQTRTPIPQHPAVKKGDEFNKLLVVVRTNLLEVYVNDKAVCDPIPLTHSLVTAALGLALTSRQEAQAEYERITIYAADAIPTPQVRAAAPPPPEPKKPRKPSKP